jgi:hypothetical protein
VHPLEETKYFVGFTEFVVLAIAMFFVGTCGLVLMCLYNGYSKTMQYL